MHGIHVVFLFSWLLVGYQVHGMPWSIKFTGETSSKSMALPSRSIWICSVITLFSFRIALMKIYNLKNATQNMVHARFDDVPKMGYLCTCSSSCFLSNLWPLLYLVQVSFFNPISLLTHILVSIPILSLKSQFCSLLPSSFFVQSPLLTISLISYDRHSWFVLMTSPFSPGSWLKIPRAPPLNGLVKGKSTGNHVFFNHHFKECPTVSSNLCNPNFVR